MAPKVFLVLQKEIFGGKLGSDYIICSINVQISAVLYVFD